MKIALIGATGFVGSAILKELVSRKHNVTAIARNTDKIPENDHTIKNSVDVMNADELALAIKESDLVISAYNPGWQNPNYVEEFAKGAESIESAVEKSGVKRFIVIGGAGTLKIDGKYVVDGENFPEWLFPAANAVKNYFANQLSKNTKLDWEFFSPAIEMHDGITTGRTGNYRYGTDSPVFDAEGKSVLSVEDLAVAIADEVDKKQFIRQQFTAAY